MARYHGRLSKTDHGLSINTSLSSGSSQTYDIPLEELLDDFIDREVSIEIHRLVPFDLDDKDARDGEAGE
ncbi:hypothetical protein GF325_12405 [Candidatus Bathyarchaeota archaeon]|nr:hypothetical protein [Candidatus Bathyarchaeota archaeon]